VKQKSSLKSQKYFERETNGKLNHRLNIVVTKINKRISQQNNYLKTVNSRCIWSSIEDLKVVLVFKRIDAGFKKPSSFA
jgi:hypothetical protein